MSLHERHKKAIIRKTQMEETRLKRMQTVVEGRRRGQTFRAIAETENRGVSEVHQDYTKAMDLLLPVEDREQYRRLMVDRLEHVLEDAVTGIELAESDREWRSNVAAMLKIQDQLIKIQGLDKHEPESGTVVDLRVTFGEVEGSLQKLVKHGLIDVDSVVKPTVPALGEGA